MDLTTEKQQMLDEHLARRGISDARVLQAMTDVPREAFVPPDVAAHAYDDGPVQIGPRQTISQPFMVASMLQAAEIAPGDRALEIGTGSGYGAAVLSKLAVSVHTIERDATLFETARRRLARLGGGHVEVRHGDGAEGWLEAGPFDVIVVTAAGPSVPAALERQLQIGGRIVIPVGSELRQRLVKRVRIDEDRFEDDDLGAVMFVPLVRDRDRDRDM